MNKQNELKRGAEQKKWQDSAKYEQSKTHLSESKMLEKELITEYNDKKREKEKKDHNL